MKPVVVVGSGPSGVHFALTLLRRNVPVVLVDVGHPRPVPVRPADRFDELKQNLADPVEYLLGSDLEGITFPGEAGEYYGVPPGKEYVFREAGGPDVTTDNFSPLFSYAAGGLAEAWTGGVYPFNDAELAAFPFGWSELRPAYEEVARRIGITGVEDDLARFMPLHDHVLKPVRLDRQSSTLMQRYDAVRERLHRRGCYIGRSRLATLTSPKDGRKACEYLSRCLWGCPVGAIYTPSMTLAECHAFPAFRYVDGVLVSHFGVSGRRITTVHGRTADGVAVEIEADTLVLAAGALSSARIFLESVYRSTGEVLALDGLMDNQQVLVPFLNLRMIGVPYDPVSYQYHMLGIGFETDAAAEYVHGQITTLTSTMAHPILKTLPFDLRTSREVFRRIRSGLGLVNVNFHDTRRPDCVLTLAPAGGREMGSLVIRYRDDPAEAGRIESALRRVRSALRTLHCIAPPVMTHTRPKGASVHYAGVLPMTGHGGSCTVTPDCRSRDFDNLILADGATFPFLPAKNITFTLMANAVRVAEAAF